VLACRLEGRSNPERLSSRDPLRLPQQLLGSPSWVSSAELRGLDRPLAPIVARWMLRPLARWLELGVQEQQRVFDREPEEVRATCARLLREVVIELGQGGRLVQPMSPIEAELVQAMEAAPGDPAPKLVYADWCAQAGLAPRAWRLHRALREALSGECALPPLEVALALGRLGDASGLGLLIEVLPERRAEVVSALPALPALLASAPAGSLDEIVLRAALQREEPGPIEVLLDQLPQYLEALPVREEQYQEGLITRAELETAIHTVRRGLQALVRAAEPHPAAAPRIREVLGMPLAARFGEDLRAWTSTLSS
jgi:uncharacterized protein (TIGR02996 family)